MGRRRRGRFRGRWCTGRRRHANQARHAKIDVEARRALDGAVICSRVGAAFLVTATAQLPRGEIRAKRTNACLGEVAGALGGVDQTEAAALQSCRQGCSNDSASLALRAVAYRQRRWRRRCLPARRDGWVLRRRRRGARRRRRGRGRRRARRRRWLPCRILLCGTVAPQEADDRQSKCEHLGHHRPIASQ